MILEHKHGLLLMRNEHLGERGWRDDASYKCIFSLFGDGAYQTLFGDRTIPKGGFTLFNPHEEHKQVYATEEKFLMEIHPSLIQEVTEQLGWKREVEFASLSYKHPQLQQWATFVRSYVQQDPDQQGIDLFLDHSVSQLGLLLCKSSVGSHSTTFPIGSVEENIKRALHALKESYTEDWSLEAMAKVSGLNKYSFAHHFKEEIGLSPYSWLQVYRLVRSQESLLSSKDSIVSIAMNHGFNHVASYNALFRKVYGKTPTMFRRQYSN